MTVPLEGVGCDRSRPSCISATCFSQDEVLSVSM